MRLLLDTPILLAHSTGPVSGRKASRQRIHGWIRFQLAPAWSTITIAESKTYKHSGP